MTINVFIEQHPNEEIRTIHLSKPVTLRPFSKYDAKGLPKKVKRLNNAFAIRPELCSPIVSDFVNHKDVRIERNKAFSWEDAMAAAVAVLERFYGEEIDVAYGERNPEWDRPRDDRDDWAY